DAVRTARQRCWRYDWVVDIDIKGFFDSRGWKRWVEQEAGVPHRTADHYIALARAIAKGLRRAMRNLAALSRALNTSLSLSTLTPSGCHSLGHQRATTSRSPSSRALGSSLPLPADFAERSAPPVLFQLVMESLCLGRCLDN